MSLNREIEMLVSIAGSGSFGFDIPIRRAIANSEVKLAPGGGGGAIFPGEDAFGVSYNLYTSEGPKVLKLRITVEDK